MSASNWSGDLENLREQMTILSREPDVLRFRFRELFKRDRQFRLQAPIARGPILLLTHVCAVGRAAETTNSVGQLRDFIQVAH